MGARTKCVPFGFTFRLKLIMTRSDRYAIYPTASRWRQISSADSAPRKYRACARLTDEPEFRAQNLERMWKEDVLQLQTMVCPPDEYTQNQIACTGPVLYQTREYSTYGELGVRGYYEHRQPLRQFARTRHPRIPYPVSRVNCQCITAW
jgi:hypothetical protein